MIYIIRHGQTELNNKQVLQGRSNYPLNEKGIEQARMAAERLRLVRFAEDPPDVVPRLRVRVGPFAVHSREGARLHRRAGFKP